MTPSLTSGGTQSLTRQTIYFFIRLANIGGFEMKNERESVLEDSENLPDIQPDDKPDIEPESTPKLEPEEKVEEKIEEILP